MKTLNAKAKSLSEAIFDTMPTGTVFSTTWFTEAVFNAFEGPDKWETTNTTSQNKVKHVARWFQQTAKKHGKIVRASRNVWVKVAH